MLITNNYCWIQQLVGHDVYSKPVYGLNTRVPCVVADLGEDLRKSSVRADSSASRGRAKELDADGMLLVPTYIKVKQDDLVTVLGVKMSVSGISIRVDSFGRDSHKEVYLKKWASKQETL